MTRIAFTPEQLARLNALLLLRVDRSGDCHLWTGCRQRDGYGQLHFAGTTWRVHRLALELALGRPLMPGMLACHHCDVRHCVRREHLFEGTIADNNRDMAAKGRQARGLQQGMHTHPEARATGLRNGKYTKPESTPRGERHGRAKLRAVEVRIIRLSSASGVSHHELALVFGVSRRLIGKIVQGELWQERIA